MNELPLSKSKHDTYHFHLLSPLISIKTFLRGRGEVDFIGSIGVQVSHLPDRIVCCFEGQKQSTLIVHWANLTGICMKIIHPRIR